MKALLNWFDDRIGYRHLIGEFLYEPIPGGSRWRYVWGSTLVFTFTVQVITGLMLWTAYSPSTQSAWESVYYIQHQMEFGWILRGVHHFTASAMVVLLALHFMQVVLDGAYRAPREVNFWLGIILLKIVLGLSLTGYLLPWDQKGYYATKVATNIGGNTPEVGTEVQQMAQGGTEYGHHTLTRFFALHAGILPALLVLFLGLHLYVFRRHAITPANPEKNSTFAFVLTLLFGPVGMIYSSIFGAIVLGALYAAGGYGVCYLSEQTELSDTVIWSIGGGAALVLNILFGFWASRSARNFIPEDSHFWPDQLFKDAVACLAVLATVLGLTWYFRGAELTAPADPTETYNAARPEWYFYFLFRFLRFEAVDKLGVVFGAIIVPGAVMGVIFLMPFIGRWKLGHRFNIAFVSGLMIAIGVLTGLAFYEDANDEEFQYSKKVATEDGERVVELAGAFGIPPEGAGALLRQDPLTRGSKLFAKKCSSCHHFEGHDGTGRVVMDLVDKTETVDGKTVVVTKTEHGQKVPVQVKKPAKPFAPDLFPIRDDLRGWTESIIVDYRGHMSALENIRVDGELSEEADILLNGTDGMAQWSIDNHDVLTDPKNERHVAALIEFLVAQSGREQFAPYDDELVELGRTVFETGGFEDVLAVGAFSSSCADCHNMTVGDTVISEPEFGPDLTGYMSQAWLKDFIRDPAAHYTQASPMPAFNQANLSDEELDLLVRWLVGDYYQAKQSSKATE